MRVVRIGIPRDELIAVARGRSGFTGGAALGNFLREGRGRAVVVQVKGHDAHARNNLNLEHDALFADRRGHILGVRGLHRGFGQLDAAVRHGDDFRRAIVVGNFQRAALGRKLFADDVHRLVGHGFDLDGGHFLVIRQRRAYLRQEADRQHHSKAQRTEFLQPVHFFLS